MVPPDSVVQVLLHSAAPQAVVVHIGGCGASQAVVVYPRRLWCTPGGCDGYRVVLGATKSIMGGGHKHVPLSGWLQIASCVWHACAYHPCVWGSSRGAQHEVCCLSRGFKPRGCKVFFCRWCACLRLVAAHLAPFGLSLPGCFTPTLTQSGCSHKAYSSVF